MLPPSNDAEYYFKNSIFSPSLNATLKQQRTVTLSTLLWSFQDIFPEIVRGQQFVSDHFALRCLSVYKFHFIIMNTNSDGITLSLKRTHVQSSVERESAQRIAVGIHPTGFKKPTGVISFKPKSDCLIFQWKDADILEACRKCTLKCKIRLHDFECFEITEIIDEPFLDPVEELTDDLKDLQDNKKFSDFCFVSNANYFKVHKFILVARCPEMLPTTWEDYKRRKEAFDRTLFPYDFLHYIYTGELDPLTDFFAIDFYRTAAGFDLIYLKEECLKFLLNNVNLSNVLEVYKLACEFSETKLVEKARDCFLKDSYLLIGSRKWFAFVKSSPKLASELAEHLLRELMADIHSGSLEWYFSQRRPQQEFGNNLIQQHRFSNHGGHNVEEHNIPGHILFDLDLLRAEDRDMDIGIDQQQEGRLEDNPAYEDIEIDGVNEEMDVEEE